MDEDQIKTLIENNPNLEKYFSQLDILKNRTAIEQKHPEVANLLYLASKSTQTFWTTKYFQ